MTTQPQFANYQRSLMIFLGVLAISLALGNPQGAALSATRVTPTNASSTPPCPLTSVPAVSAKCVSFQGHLYAVADVNLQSHEIVFSTTVDGNLKAYPALVGDLYRVGVKPILVTNAGIYGTDNQPLGLLITPKGKKHGLNLHEGRGNFSWDSAVFAIFDDGTASIVPASSWQDSPHAIAATQSGPQLASLGKINQAFRPQSAWSYRRTAVGVERSNGSLVHLVVSREDVTLFELATFMVNELHCSEALHLDGDLSAFYIPSASNKFVFSDPGERIATALSVIEKKAN